MRVWQESCALEKYKGNDVTLVFVFAFVLEELT